jgi:hydrogenase-4 component F
MISQHDVKRLLAYSSVEHMGVLVLGLGLGGAGAYGSAFHVVTNGLTKGWLFLTVGNVLLVSGTPIAGSVRGLFRGAPVTGLLLAGGLFAMTGSPPFAMFVSEFTILRAAIDTGHSWIAAVMVFLLAVIFIGVARTLLDMRPRGARGPGPAAWHPRARTDP